MGKDRVQYIKDRPHIRKTDEGKIKRLYNHALKSSGNTDEPKLKECLTYNRRVKSNVIKN